MKKLFINTIGIALLLCSNLSFSENQTLNLGILSTFEAFTGGGAISNAAGATINGDVGTHLGIISGPYDPNYKQYNADDTTDQARKDLLRIYIHLNDLYVDYPSTHAPAFGGGETITPGVYSIGGAGSIGGALTLDGQGDPNSFFIIKFNGAFTVGAAAEVNLINGINPSNVFWIADGAISVAANANVKGTLFSKTGAVGLGAGVTLEGRMLTMAGAITNGTGASASQPEGDISIVIFCEMTCIPASEVDVLGVVSDYVLFTSLGAVANTGISGVIGKIGTNSGAISGYTNGIHIGSEHIADSDTALAKIDLDNAYTALMDLPDTNTSHTPAFGTGETLFEGVYKIEGAGSLAGTITLDGDGDPDAIFVFKFAGAFAVGAQSKVILTNGARRCNVFWLGGAGVATGAVNIGAASQVKGNFISHGGASNSGANVFLGGRQLSTGGAVNTNAGTIYTTPECVGPMAQADHFNIDHDGNAINCLAEEITISAHKADHTVETGYTGTITLSTDTGNGDWSYVRGGNADNLTNQNNGAATYIFGDTESGSVILGLTNTVAETIDIDVKEDPISGLSEKSGEARDADDLPLVYKAAGFIFHDGSADKNDIGMQIAGKPSDTGYGAQLNLVIEAVNTDTETGACEAALTNDIEVKIGFECRSPSNCQRPLYLGSGSASELIPFTNANSTVNYEGVSLNFGGTDTGDSTANFVMNYPDAGQIRLHAEYTIDNTAPEPDIVLQGSSNDFVSRPFGFDLVVTDNQAATDSDGNVFRTAGDPFEVVTTAALWQAADDNDTEDGIPDNHNDTAAGIASRDDLNNSITLGDNNSYTGTPNFAEPLTLSSALFAPNAGSNPALAVTTAAWIGGVHTSNVRFDEVGIIEITARLTNEYLDIDGGSGMTETNKIASQSGYVGRFIPNSFTVEVTDSGQFVNSCTSGASAFTYIGETFGFDTPPAFTVTAWNAADPVSITTNYRGSYRKLDGTSITIADVTRDMTKEGTDNTPLNVEFIADNVKLTSPTTSENGTLDYTFGDDQFRYGPEDPNNADFGKMANSEVLPFDADIDLVLTQVVDGDAVETIFSPSITFDVTGNQLRFGQLQTGNVFGREIDDLKMSMVVKYLNASGFFVINTDDNNCTQIDTGDLDVTLTPSTSTSIVSITNTPNEAGRHVDITAPGNGNNDVVRVSPNLDTSVDKWLRYDWNNDGNFNNDPSSTATFGINKGNPVQIFMQQIYQ
jgi:hypothetical protein